MANNNNQNIKDLKEALLEKLPSTRVREQELLCHHTTFKIGGPADLFIEPTTMDELSFTLFPTIARSNRYNQAFCPAVPSSISPGRYFPA